MQFEQSWFYAGYLFGFTTNCQVFALRPPTSANLAAEDHHGLKTYTKKTLAQFKRHRKSSQVDQHRRKKAITSNIFPREASREPQHWVKSAKMEKDMPQECTKIPSTNYANLAADWQQESTMASKPKQLSGPTSPQKSNHLQHISTRSFKRAPTWKRICLRSEESPNIG